MKQLIQLNCVLALCINRCVNRFVVLVVQSDFLRELTLYKQFPLDILGQLELYNAFSSCIHCFIQPVHSLSKLLLCSRKLSKRSQRYKLCLKI